MTQHYIVTIAPDLKRGTIRSAKMVDAWSLSVDGELLFNNYRPQSYIARATAVRKALRCARGMV